MIRSVFLILILTRLASAEVVQGLVLEDHSGAPVLGASVKLKTGAGTTLKEMDTDRTGRFVASDIPAGEYLVSVSKSNYATVNARMAARPNAGPLPVLRLIKYGVIAGHITSPRMGGTVVVVEVVSEGQNPRSHSGAIGATGDFRIFGIPPGRYQLTAPLTAGTNPEALRGLALYPNNAQPREFIINGGEEFTVQDFTVPAGGASSISGKVTGPGTTQTFSLSLMESEHSSIRLMTALTREGGDFHFDNILPGVYDLFATGPVTPPPSFFARVHLVLNGQKIENMDLVLKPGSVVEFAMSSNTATTNSACSPDGVVNLQAVGAWTYGRDLRLTAPISPTAPARIENVAPGPFAVTARSSSGNCIGVTTASVDLRKDATPERATVVFQPPSGIHGTVPHGNVVVLRDMTPGHETMVQAFYALADAEYRFENLLPGQYCVSAQSATDTLRRWAPESACARMIDLHAGEPQIADIRPAEN